MRIDIRITYENESIRDASFAGYNAAIDWLNELEINEDKVEEEPDNTGN